MPSGAFLNGKTGRRLTLLRTLPHGEVGALEVPAQSIGVEQAAGRPRVLQPRAQHAKSIGISGERKSETFVLLPARRNQLRQAMALSKLPAMRETNERPAHVTTGTPAQRASLVVVAPLTGAVSRHRSASAILAT
jgi:hypothetical protein